MTPAQQELLGYIRAAIDRTGISPSYAEMAEAMALKSKGNIAGIVSRLIRDGWLVRTGPKGAERALRIAVRELGDAPTYLLIDELVRRGYRVREAA